MIIIIVDEFNDSRSVGKFQISRDSVFPSSRVKFLLQYSVGTLSIRTCLDKKYVGGAAFVHVI